MKPSRKLFSLRFMLSLLLLTASIQYMSEASAGNRSVPGYRETLRNGGLRFNAYRVIDAKRTALFLDEGRAMKLGKDFILSFTLNCHEGPVYGNIVTISLDNKTDLRLMMLPDEKDVPTLHLVNNHNKVVKISHAPAIGEDVRVSIRLHDNQADVRLGERGRPVTGDLAGATFATVTFGISDNRITDVLPMDLRDITIERDGERIRNWSLGVHTPSGMSIDSINGSAASTRNPIWTLDFHHKWREYGSLLSESPVNFSFLPDSATFVVTRDDEMIFMRPNGDIHSRKIAGGKPAVRFPGPLPLLAGGGGIASYSLKSGHVSTISLTDPSPEWSSDTSDNPGSHIYNNAFAYNPRDSSWYFFGGYGNYRYQNSLYRLYDGKLERLNYSGNIPPRLNPAAAVVGGSLYIFGGLGNESGHQELRNQFYCDLYRIDLKTLRVEKVWEMENGNMEFGSYMSPSMFYSESEKAFYAFSTKVPGCLWRISTTKPGIDIVSAPIELKERYKETFSQLYISTDEQALFLASDLITQDGKHDFRIYRLDLPLLSESDIILDDKNEPESFLWIISGIILISILSAAALILRRRRSRDNTLSPADTSSSAAPSPGAEDETKEERGDMAGPRQGILINLLGDFRVCDREGNDISDRFTPRMRDLLALLILYSESKDHGIDAEKIDDLIWGDKNRTAARNNRYVSLSKLKQQLAPLGDVEIIRNGQLLSIRLGEGLGCDYRAVADIFSKAIHLGYSSITAEEKSLLIDILERGPLLPWLNAEWAESLVEHFNETSLSVLPELRQGELDLGNVRRAARISRLIEQRLKSLR